jgi:glycosyltransferase involved in cell wall biosynthesis
MTKKFLPLSLAVITLNEEKNLPRCLESAKDLVSEIVVIDSGSTDRTTEIAESFGAQVHFNPWPGHIAQKNVALSRCTQPWVISLDADEMISEELRQSVKNLFKLGEPSCAGYWINRKTYCLGAWIQHAWYPEWRIRLVKKDKAIWTGTNPHDKLETQGSVGKIQGDILHYSYVDLEDQFKRAIDYGRIGALAMMDKGKKFQWHNLLFSPWVRFIKSLVFKQAWRDGWRGWIIAFSSFLTCFIKYAFMYEATLQNHHEDKEKKIQTGLKTDR